MSVCSLTRGINPGEDMESCQLPKRRGRQDTKGAPFRRHVENSSVDEWKTSCQHSTNNIWHTQMKATPFSVELSQVTDVFCVAAKKRAKQHSCTRLSFRPTVGVWRLLALYSTWINHLHSIWINNLHSICVWRKLTICVQRESTNQHLEKYHLPYPTQPVGLCYQYYPNHIMPSQ